MAHLIAESPISFRNWITFAQYPTLFMPAHRSTVTAQWLFQTLCPVMCPLESQIMVLEVLDQERSIIFVIDMVIFSERVVRSETSVKIPWSDWGPQYTCCFPHHPTHRISVFGSRMAYALPVDYTPEPGQRVKRYQNHFYVHIWDFNKRVITREKNVHDFSSPGPLIRKPGLIAQSSCFVEDLITHLPYTTAVCRTPFKMSGFNMLFLEQDRFTLTWVGLLVVGVRNDVLMRQNCSRDLITARSTSRLFALYRRRLTRTSQTRAFQVGKCYNDY
jgi:hypothetical protein